MRDAEVIGRSEAGLQAGAVITPEEIRAYLDDLSRRGRSRGTVQMYRAKLRAFYGSLPPDKQVEPDTLADWRSALLEGGYSINPSSRPMDALPFPLEQKNRVRRIHRTRFMRYCLCEYCVHRVRQNCRTRSVRYCPTNHRVYRV